MIQIQKVKIEEFRGIRDLELTLDCGNFVVSGPNGSGKSGVVDAIDFALTGNVQRLTGSGTSGVSVKDHAPHVHKRDDPGAAKVALTFVDCATGESGTVLRTVKSPLKYALTPDTSAIRTAFESAQGHPELTLSRREIIKYILNPSGQRAAEVGALLKLDRIENQRLALRSAVGKLSKDKTGADAQLKAAREQCERHLDLPTLASEQVLATVNARRTVLDLEPLTGVAIDSDFKAGIDQASGEVAFSKEGALREVDAMIDWLQATPETLATPIAEAAESLQAILGDPSLSDALKHRALYEAGHDLLESSACPLCDHDWESPEALRAHLFAKLDQSANAKNLRDAIGASLATLTAKSREGRGALSGVLQLAERWADPEILAVLRSWQETQIDFEGHFSTPDSALVHADDLRIPLGSVEAVNGALNALRTILNSKPDTSGLVQARDFLISASERWHALRSARLLSETITKVHGAGTTAYQQFCEAADGCLTKLYESVEARMGQLYARINADDENDFKAELLPSEGSLDLKVAFYGLGMFPPGAYHSEGHQDGMGICLYLALVESLLGSEFRFAVLDDVVTSIDMNHRRQFCDLLKSEFSHVQFVMTTHDEVWRKQMESTGLISRKAQAKLRGWNVHRGPAAEQGADFWSHINELVTGDEISEAAWVLRNGLEAELPEISELLRAQITFRGDAKYELGDHLNGVKSRYKKLLSMAADSANSWISEDAKEKVKALQESRRAAVLVADSEQWTINALVHFNEWATMSKADFAPVVEAWRDFMALFRCESCNSWIHITGFPKEEALRCDCQSYSLNLMVKPAA